MHLYITYEGTGRRDSRKVLHKVEISRHYCKGVDGGYVIVQAGNLGNSYYSDNS